LFSCKNKKDAGGAVEIDGTITVSLDMDEERIVDISEFVDSVKFIRLDNSSECLIGEIQKVIFYDGSYYIQDNAASSIFVFDETGKFKFKIFRKGQGPGEYVQITHMLMDYGNRRILIYDVTMRKMIYYTLDGEFIKEINGFSSGAVIRDLILLRDGSCLCYTPDYMKGNEYWGVWRTDTLGKPADFLWKPTAPYPVTHQYNMLYFYELPSGEVGLWCPDINDIFHFANDSVYRYMSVTVNKKSAVDFPDMTRKEVTDKFISKTSVTEKDNIIITGWWDGERLNKTSIYLKKEKKSIVGGIGYASDIAIPGMDIHFNRTDQLLQVIYAHEAEHFVKNEHYKSDKNKAVLRSMFDNFEDDNPVLEILYLKK
jgi:hypothetical protein